MIVCFLTQTGSVASSLSVGGKAISRANPCSAGAVPVPNTGMFLRGTDWTLPSYRVFVRDAEDSSVVLRI